MGFAAGNVIKYVIRQEEKGGIVNLEKARWYLERLIDEKYLPDERDGRNDNSA